MKINNTKKICLSFSTGVRMLDGEVSDYVEAEALSLRPDYIDIYSASWGPDDNGKVVDGPAKLAREAFVTGVLKVMIFIHIMHRLYTTGPVFVQVTIYRRLRIDRDGHLDQSEAYDIS